MPPRPAARENDAPAGEVAPRPLVSVIIPCFQAEGTLEACLRALAAQEGPPDHEVILVENGSTDATPELARGLQDLFAGRLLLVEEGRPGSYAARNRGLEVARGDILLFTDADCVPSPGWMRALAEPLMTVPELLLVGGTIRGVPEQPGLLARYARTAGILGQEGALRHPRGPFVQTANLAVRAEAARAVGGFDASLFSGGDAVFCWRLQERLGEAARPRLVEDAVIEHLHRESLGALWRQFFRYGQSDLVLHRRFGTPPGRRLRRVVTDAARLLLALPMALALTPWAAARRDPLPALAPLLRALRALARRCGQLDAWLRPRHLRRS
jgi:glycosyltransferase involved in cell wall biosynthesis